MAEKKVVFVSSTSADLSEYRRAVFDTLLKMDFIPSGMEFWAVVDKSSVDLCLSKIKEAELFIGIYAHRYGWRPDGPGTRSITEMEYDWATEQGIPRLCFIMDNTHPWPREQMESEAQEDLDAFKRRVQLNYTGFFTTPDNLSRQVAEAVAKYNTSFKENILKNPVSEELRTKGPILLEHNREPQLSTVEETKVLSDNTQIEPKSQVTAQEASQDELATLEDNLPARMSGEHQVPGKSSKQRFLDHVLSLTQKPNSLLCFSEWAAISEFDIQLEYQTDESRVEFVQMVQNLTGSATTNGIRLMGKPGIGKTRLVLETIRQLGLEDGTVYAAAPESLPGNLFSCLALAKEQPIILVVDNCSYRDVRAIWDSAQLAGSHVHVITIESLVGNPPSNSQFPIHILQPLGHEARQNIVRQLYDLHGTYTFNDDKAAYPEETVGENLKLLVAYIKAFHLHPEIAGLAELSQTEELKRLLDQRIPTDHNELRTLQGLALSDYTGFYPRVKLDIQAIAEFVGLSYPEFRQSAETLREQGVIIERNWYQRDSHHRLVLPRLFAVYLARQVWSARGDDVLESFLLDQREGLQSLRLGMLERLADLGHRDIAFPIVNRLLSRFNKFDDLEQDTATYRWLGEADPATVAEHLNQLMQEVSIERLREFKEGRRNIISLLTSLLRLEETFWIAAELLGRLAAAENETFGNNATEIWRSIFFIRSGSNPIKGLERLRLIRDFLAMRQPEMRIAALKAIEGVLNNYEGGVVTRGPGGYITPPTWRPKTWGEFWDIRRATWQLLDHALSDGDPEVASTASDLVLKYAIHQIPVLLHEVLEQLRTLSNQVEYRLRVWKTLQGFSTHRAKDLDPEQMAAIQTFADELVTDSYHDQLEIYVADFDIFERSSHDQFDESKQLLADKIRELAKQGLRDESLGAELDWLVTLDPWQRGSQVWSFIYEVGRFDQDLRWFKKLAELVNDRRQLPYIEAYLRGQVANGNTAWVKKQVRDWSETDELLGPVLLLLPDVAYEGDKILEPLLRMLDRNWISVLDLADRRLERFCTDALSTEGIRRLLGRIIEDASPEGIYVGTAYLYERLHKNQEEASEFVDVAFHLMASSAGEFAERSLYDWYKEELENLYLAQYPREIVDIVLQEFRDSNGYIFDFTGDRDVIRNMLIRAMQLDAQSALDILETTILPEEHPRHISPFQFRGLHINLYARTDDLLSWAKRNKPDGPRSLAEMCFVGDVPLNETVRGLLVQNPDDDEVWSRLTRKFTQLEMLEVSQIPNRLRELRDVARKWLEDDEPQVRRWAQQVIAGLESQLLRRGP